MNYAVDWDSVIKYVLAGRGYRRATLLNPWYQCYDTEVKPFPYDPEKAKDLLRQAGFPNGFQITFHVVQGRVPKDKEVGEAMAGMFAKVGIRCNVRIIDVGTYVSQGAAGKLDGLMFGSHGNWMHEPDNSLHNNYFSASQASRMYRGGWKSEEFDKTVEQARYELDGSKRCRLYTQAQKILMDECPDVFAYAIEDVYGVNNRIKWTPRADEMIWYKEMSPA
jgi:peptide/nickel transport system substrate-binding protein